MGNMHEAINLLIAIFGTYGLATMIAEYDGPAHLFEKLRSLKYIGPLFRCNVCMSPYFALIFLFGMGLPFLAYLGVVGACVFLARVS